MAVKFQDYYETLGVSRDADLKKIKAAYRKLARQWHPDLHSGSDKEIAEEKFKQINEAYEVLSDNEKRSRYDRLGENWRHGDMFAPGSDPGAGGGYYYTSGDFDEAGLGGFSEFFETLFGRQSGRQAERPFGTGPRRGLDVESRLDITLEEAYRGGDRTAAFSQESICPRCQGQGRIGRSFCSQCGGTGITRQEKKLEVKIPAGISDGSRLRLKGQGGEGIDGGPRGDLYLKVHIRPHPVFTLKRSDLESEVTIRPEQAVLGDQIEVVTLDGKVQVTVPPQSHTGRKLRLKGKGMPTRAGQRGDHYLRLKIDIPAHLESEEKGLYARLAELRGKGD